MITLRHRNILPGEKRTLSAVGPPGFKIVTLDPTPAARKEMERTTFEIHEVDVDYAPSGNLVLSIVVENTGKQAAGFEIDALGHDEVVETVEGYRRK